MVRDTDMSNDGTDVVLGEDWVDPESSADAQLRARRARKKSISVNRSPLARKIITFNLLGLVVLIGLLPGWLLDMIQTGSAFAPFQATGGPQ